MVYVANWLPKITNTLNMRNQIIDSDDVIVWDEFIHFGSLQHGDPVRYDLSEISSVDFFEV